MEGGGQVAVKDGRMEMVVEEGGGSGGAEVAVEGWGGGGGSQQDTSLQAPVPDLQS